MSYTRYGEHVTLAMTPDEYAQLLLMLGYALGARHKEGDLGGFYRWLAFVNDLNTGNPQFTPYEIPDRYREEIR